MPSTDAKVEVISLAGEVDGLTRAVLRERIDSALVSGRAVLVDLTDCTYLDVEALRELDGSFRRARELGVGFAVELPVYASHGVTRMLLELAPELVRYAVVPTRVAAARVLGPRGTFDAEYVSALRARSWQLARRQDELRSERDALLMELRGKLGVRRAAAAPDSRQPDVS